MKAIASFALVLSLAAPVLAADGSQPPMGVPEVPASTTTAPAPSKAPVKPATPSTGAAAPKAPAAPAATEPAVPAATPAPLSAVPVSRDGAAPVRAATPAPAPSSGEITVAGLACGPAVENRELVGAAASFDGPSVRLYCWNRVTAAQVPTTIRHVWYHNGEMKFEVPLTIKVSPMRTWSYRDAAAGTWKVEAVDGAGAVLASTEFSVGAGPAQ